MLVYKCDICGSIYNNGNFRNTAKLSYDNPFLGQLELDICNDCHAKLYEYIKELQGVNKSEDKAIDCN